jgi:hypothetical protein
MPLAQQFPTAEMIRGTFDLMLRQLGHRGTALRLTCRDLGLPDDAVRAALGRGGADEAPSRLH